MNNLVKSLRMAAPIFLAILFLTVAIFGPWLKDLSITLETPANYFFTIKFTATKVHAQLIFLAVSAGLATWIPLRDYTKFFPSQLNIIVNFDQEGIENQWRKTPQFIKEKYTLCSDSNLKRQSFFKRLEVLVESKTGDIIDTSNLNRVHGVGDTSFVVKKISPGQRYEICGAGGQLSISSTGYSTEVDTRFSLLKTKSRIFSVPVFRILFRHIFVVEPVFVQSYMENATTKVDFSELVVVTVIRVFPYISIKDSMYLAKEGDTYFPVGYCIYAEK